MSASDISKPSFDIKANEDKPNISTPMLSGSVKNESGSLDAGERTLDIRMDQKGCNCTTIIYY